MSEEMEKYYSVIRSFTGDYEFLSNSYRCITVYKGEKYNSVEHAFNAAKFNDKDIRAIIQRQISPLEAREIANGKYQDQIREDWDEVKLSIMKELVRQKFQEKELREKLLKTGSKEIRNGNWLHETFWGIDIYQKRGENHLGKILMEIREEIR